MIPKTIHQIWIGKKQPPQELIDSWKMEGFNHILWNEEKIDSLNMLSRDKYDYFYNKGSYFGAADIARVEILYQYGGLYIDADTLRLKDIPKEWFDVDFLSVEANKSSQWSYRIVNGILGSKPKGSIITNYRLQIHSSKKIEPCWRTIGGTLLTKIFLEDNTDNTIILEPYTFFPKNMKGKVEPRANEAYAQHFWGSKTKKVYK